jgi:MFS family permease
MTSWLTTALNSYLFGDEWVLPASWQIAFNTATTPGQIGGGFACGWVANRWGRRAALSVGILFCVGGIVGQVLSSTRIAFLMSKYVLGVGLGFYLTIAPLCTSEIAPVQLRGIATAGVNLGIAVGQLLSNSVVAGFGSRTDRWAYRAPFAIQIAFSLFLLAGLPFAPESVWFLVKKGKNEEARRALVKLWGKDVDVDLKLQGVQITVAEEATSEELTIKDCFRGTHRIRTFISMGVFACQHLVGIVFVLGYSSYFFQLAGLATEDSFYMGVGGELLFTLENLTCQIC